MCLRYCATVLNGCFFLETVVPAVEEIFCDMLHKSWRLTRQLITFAYALDQRKEGKEKCD